jgi:hypothetical protein
MKDACDSCKLRIASSIAFNAAAWGANNIYEGVGIFRMCKSRISESK